MPAFWMYPPVSPGPYAGAMETEHNKAVFGGMHEMKNRLTSAIERCKQVEMTEALMGYPKSAQEYFDITEELKDVKPWIEKYMQELLQLN